MLESAKPILEDIADQKRELRAKIKELTAIEKAIKALGPKDDGAKSTDEPTIKEMAIGVLKSEARGLEALEIIAGIRSHYGRSIERTSISPQLSRLKNDGELVLHKDTQRWFLPDVFEAWQARDAHSQKANDKDIIDAAVQEQALDRAANVMRKTKEISGPGGFDFEAWKAMKGIS